jgi:D-alanyl-D-alanine carboxypeptidase
MRFVVRRGLLAALAAALAISFAAAPADAARKRSRKPAHTVTRQSDDDGVGGSKYAAYVVDDNTGKVLFARNAEAPRHPASLTKMLTLYVLFEELERGRVKLDTEMPVSPKAADQDPTKLGLRAGGTLTVEEAIKGLITLSANDAAMVIAEFIGGSQDGFADRMNATAKRIGMTSSRFYNPNGLPDGRQITTAKDMVTLGSALSERFPTYYRYFQTRSFVFRGRTIAGHNRLLGRVDGVDGIKTGYTRASGFNLVSSIRRDGKHLVAAVLGGSSGGARDRHMQQLLETYIAQASSAKGTTVATAAAIAAQPPRKTALTEPIKIVAEAEPTPKPSIERGAAVAMARAVLLPDTQPQAAPPRLAVATTAPALPPVAAAPSRPVVFATAGDNLQPKDTSRLLAADAAPRAKAADAAPRVNSLAEATISTKDVADLVETASLGRAGRADKQPRTAANAAPALAPQVASVKTVAEPAPQGGWVIQIGAVDGETAARGLIAKAQDKAGTALKGRTGFTEQASKGVVRARFAGFADQSAANAACSALKKKSFACLALKR